MEIFDVLAGNWKDPPHEIEREILEDSQLEYQSLREMCTMTVGETGVYADLRLIMNCSILSADPLLGAGTWCRWQVSRSITVCAGDWGPTCIVKIISDHSGPLIPPALGQPQ